MFLQSCLRMFHLLKTCIMFLFGDSKFWWDFPGLNKGQLRNEIFLLLFVRPPGGLLPATSYYFLCGHINFLLPPNSFLHTTALPCKGRFICPNCAITPPTIHRSVKWAFVENLKLRGNSDFRRKWNTPFFFSN